MSWSRHRMPDAPSHNRAVKTWSDARDLRIPVIAITAPSVSGEMVACGGLAELVEKPLTRKRCDEWSYAIRRGTGQDGYGVSNGDLRI